MDWTTDGLKARPAASCLSEKPAARLPATSINRGMGKDDFCVVTREYYSAKERNKIVLFAETHMGLETVRQNEVSQKEKKSSVCQRVCVASRKMVQTHSSAKQEERHTKVEGGGGDEPGDWDRRIYALICKID